MQIITNTGFSSVKQLFFGKNSSVSNENYSRISFKKEKKQINQDVFEYSANKSLLSKYEDLLNKKISSNVALEALKLDDSQYKKFETLLGKKVSSIDALKAVKLDEEKYAKFVALIDKGESSFFILELLELPDDKYKKFEKLFDKGVHSYHALEALKLPENKYKNFEKLIEKGMDLYDSFRAIRLDDEKYAKFETLINKGIDSNVSFRAIRLDDEKYAKFETLINKGIDSNVSLSAVELDGEKYERFIALTDKGVNSNDSFKALKLNDKKYAKFNELIEKGVDSRLALSAIELNSEEYTRFETLIKKGINSNSLLKVVHLDNAKFQNFENLISKGINIQIAAELVHCLNDDYSNLSLKEKLNIFEELKNIIETYTFTDKEVKIFNVEDEIKKVENSIKQVITVTDVSKDKTIQMLKGFFANNNTELEKTLSTTDFSKYGKKGIPLAYPRTEFLSDLSVQLSKLPASIQTEIVKKLCIEVIKNENGNITGYDGIIDLTKLSSEGAEGKVLELANNFILNNKVVTGDSEVDNMLNSLISGMPEFINLIGKQQQATQELSVDLHVLSVLQNVINDSEYENLSDSDKFCLKFAAVLHDIAKSEGGIDKKHSETSAIYARDILNKLKLPAETRNRIFEMVKNHHWLSEYNNGEVKADRVAAMFRRQGDLTAARILAKADLKGVGKKFYEINNSALSDKKQSEITESLNEINSTGQILLTNSIIDKSKVPVVEYNGKTYQVINFSELPPETDLQQYGFEPNTTVQSLRMLVHATCVYSLKNLEAVLNLGDCANEGFLCASYISAKNNYLYEDNRFGLSLQSENVNIANASYYNQSSGCEKNYKSFSNVITGNSAVSMYRDKISNGIKSELKLTDDEYSQLYTIIQKYKHASQLDNIPSVNVGEKTFTGTQIKEAIISADDSIISRCGHNEVNVYTPQVNAVVAKVNTIEKVPSTLLYFAQKYNLPIFLMGKD